MRVFKYLMEHKLAFTAVVLCFIIQAFCDLSLPRYTSDIVDVGIQQQGIEYAVPEQLSAESYEATQLFMTSEEKQAFQSAYSFDLDENCYVLQDGQATELLETLDSLISPALALAFAAQSAGVDATQLAAQFATYADDASLLANRQAMLEEWGLGSPSLVEQTALAAVRAEYETLGISLEDVQLNYLLHIGFTMMALVLFAMIIHSVMNFFACRTAMQIGRDLRSRFFNKIVSFSSVEIDSFSAASLITRGTNDIQQVSMLCLMAQRMMVYTPIIALGGIYMVIKTNASMGWIIVLAIVLVLLCIVILFAVTMPRFKIMQKLIDKVNLVAREILTGLPVIRAFNREELEEARFEDANATLMKTQIFTNRAMSFMMPLMMLVMNLCSVLIVWVGSHYVDLGTVQTGDLIAFITYSMIIITSFLMIGMIAIMLPRASVAAARVDEVINASITIQDACKVYELDEATKSAPQIEFKDVNFRYHADSTNALEKLSFSIQPGETFALIGPTGCGKSSVLKLLLRLYEVNEGAILINGVDIREYSQEDLRSLFSYVPQRAFLFSGTIESNVSYGMEDTDGACFENSLQEALQIAQADEFVQEHKDGLKRSIAQGGTNVSGGQRQRLTIARALASDAPVLLFDDSFSALDYKTDAALRHELQTKRKDKTCVIVAQRIATIKDADKILVLDDGQMVGFGTHEQLLESCSTYQDIAYSQLSEEELKQGGVAHV